MAVETSSFFWLGLVGAAFFAFVMAILRARLARTPEAIPRRRLSPPPKPELWDVYVSLEELGVEKFKTVAESWSDWFPLACRVSAEQEGMSKPQAQQVPPVPSLPPRRKFPFFKHTPQTPAGSELPRQPPGPLSAQIATIVLMPSPSRAQGLHGQNGSHGDLDEYTIGTVWVQGPPLQTIYSASTDS